MFLFETIVFSNRVPSYYKVYFQNNKYYFEAVPLEYYKHVQFPNFSIGETVTGTWEAEGTSDRELIQQVLEDIRKFAPTKRLEAIA